MTLDASLPILLALGTAATFATSATLVRFGVERSTPLVALVVTLTVNILVLWAGTLLYYDVSLDLWALRYFILAGVFAPALGRLCNYIGIQRVGVNLSVPISNSNPVVAVILAVLVLEESISSVGLVGILLVIGGGILLSTVRGGETRQYKRTDILYPILGAAFYGGTQILRDLGLDLVPLPALGAAVNLTTSWLLVCGYLLFTSSADQLSVRDPSLVYFVPAGIASSIGLVCLYSALQLGQVVIVTPILNTSPLFALAITYLVARDGELFTRRVIVGTCCIVGGVSLLSVVT
ncbi:DMT family transporter [Haloarcula amylovorans]|uniref:DMT family transporter n=1 Tax=Haloarcula amylovorans TaxID=2562280 RepID=UPI00107646B4|nr:EamA family transporter [Halomicroarcula amylolytica]